MVKKKGKQRLEMRREDQKREGGREGTAERSFWCCCCLAVG
jgi:hypothetical protein